MGTRERLRRERMMRGVEAPYKHKIVNTNLLYYLGEARRLYGPEAINKMLLLHIQANYRGEEGC